MKLGFYSNWYMMASTIKKKFNRITIDNLENFREGVLRWYRVKGRHDLPWKNPPTPYRVWISEIMLQQTQVDTVKPYFARFMARFPEVATLAQASLDQVMALWSGLGYYRRAKHLHSAAQMILVDFLGVIPRRLEELQSLPGIGRTTAAAIASLAYGEFEAILDANVKRVLQRYFDGAASFNKADLWLLAEAALSKVDSAAYNQGMMDLGATICVAKRPRCLDCPLQLHCVFFRLQGERGVSAGEVPAVEVPAVEVPAVEVPAGEVPAGEVPAGEVPAGEVPAGERSVFKGLPRRSVKGKKRFQYWMVLIGYQQEIWLERREERGIWGGLWSFPLHKEVPVITGQPLWEKRAEMWTHQFSHQTWEIRPLMVYYQQRPDLESKSGQWFALPLTEAIGLPKPVMDGIELIQPLLREHL
jgi:A/G-specific adenine glycosylase